MPPDNIPMGVRSGRDATGRLRAVIEENQKVTERQTRSMIRLTWVMTFLTAVTAILTAVIAAPIAIQIWKFVRSWAFWQAVSVWFP